MSQSAAAVGTAAPSTKRTAQIEDYVEFRDERLARKWHGRRMPVSVLYEAYMDERLDINDLSGLLANRHDLIRCRLTAGHLKWFVARFLPEAIIHSRAYDARLVRGHYDRGDDFFEAFLGETMAYSAAHFDSESDTLEQAQTAKFDRVCSKLRLMPGERLLDVGCGWGALVAHAAKNYRAEVTGLTLSQRQAKRGIERLGQQRIGANAEIVCADYRDAPDQQFDKIVSLEMVEHVGIRNLRKYFRAIHDRLSDDGLFLMQWTGLRQKLKSEDLLWGLFMNRYIFPGADASLPPPAMLKAAEKSGFELRSIENVSPHYVLTLRRWQENWESNRSAIVDSYGERWRRLWKFFLAWSIVIGEQGSAACFQAVFNKNLEGFDRHGLE